MPETDLVVIRTFTTSVDAELARSVLESAGIDSMIRADDCGGAYPQLQMTGVDLLVAADQAVNAEALLSELLVELAPDSDPPASE